MRNRAVQAFWAMHVEAMSWSGMSVREYAAALHLSPTSLRKWRDLLDVGEVISTGERIFIPQPVRSLALVLRGRRRKRALTAPPSGDPAPPRQLPRRFFSDEQKLAIALESEQPRVSVSQVARMHGIVAGLLFRWRVQFGVAQRQAREACARRCSADDAPASFCCVVSCSRLSE